MISKSVAVPRSRLVLDLRVAGLVVLALVAVAPMLIAGPVPALLDYPNHLARMAILMREGTPEASPYYVSAWAFMPNLAMDAIVPPLGRLIGIEAAARVFLVASQLLVIGGAVALDLAVKGRVAWAGYAAVLFLYSPPFAWGFVNFQFGLGLALFAFAGWIRLSRGPALPLVLWHVAAATILFGCHLFALGLYGWSVGLFELWRWHRERVPLPRRAAIVALLVAPPAILLAITHLTGASVGANLSVWSITSKSTFMLAASGFSRPVALAIILPLLVVLYLLWRDGEAQLIGAGRLLLPGFALLFLVMPHRLLDTALVDIRVVTAAFLILPAFTEIAFRSERRLLAARLGLSSMIALTFGAAAFVQWSFAPTYQTLLAAFDALPKRAKIVVAYHDGSGDLPERLPDLPLHHAANLAIVRANALVPTLFMHPGKQPVRPAEAVRGITVPEGDPVPLRVLAQLLDRPAVRIEGAAHLQRWASDFDYLLLLSPEGLPPRPEVPAGLDLVAREHRFALYRIARAN